MDEFGDQEPITGRDFWQNHDQTTCFFYDMIPCMPAWRLNSLILRSVIIRLGKKKWPSPILMVYMPTLVTISIAGIWILKLTISSLLSFIFWKMTFDFWYGEEFLIEQEQISCYGYERLRHVTGHIDPESVFDNLLPWTW